MNTFTFYFEYNGKLHPWTTVAENEDKAYCEYMDWAEEHPQVKLIP